MYEHNHGKLWIGYAISIFILGVGIFMGTTSIFTEELITKGFIFFVTGLLFIAGFLMLKEIFQMKEKCEACEKRTRN